MVFTISRTIRHDMPKLRIWWYWQSEPRLGRPALDVASSRPVPLPPVPSEISRLVLESMTCDFPWNLFTSTVTRYYVQVTNHTLLLGRLLNTWRQGRSNPGTPA